VVSLLTRPTTSTPAPATATAAWVAAERIAFDEAKSRRPRVELINHGVPMIPAAPVWCRECQTAITDTIGKFPDLCAGLTHRDAQHWARCEHRTPQRRDRPAHELAGVGPG